MSTTDLFVEIVIIGVGALIWVCLGIMSIFGVDILSTSLLSDIVVLIFLLTTSYVLGIIVDRLADAIFSSLWERKIKKEYYESEVGDYEDRRFIYTHDSDLKRLLEYGRSRIRICLGWFVNCIFILLFSNILVWKISIGPDLRIKVLVASNVVLVILLFGLFFTWKQLTRTEMRKVKEQSAFLRTLR